MDTTRPEITIGIPTRNGGAVLARALAAVFAQECAQEYEVIALDSGSTDGTLERLAAWRVRVIPVAQDTFDWGRVREQLFTEARGEIVVSLSQDAIPASTHWLEALVRPLEDPAIAVSCGGSIPDAARAFPQFAWERNGRYYFTREIAKFRTRYGRGLSFANTAVRRSVWQTHHFDPQATGEDFQFQMKLHAAGLPIAFPDDAPVLHHHNYSLRGVYRRCRNEGLALREMGCAYSGGDLIADLARPDNYVQLLREAWHGRLRSLPEVLYPALRPVAVYHGSRFARKMVWY